MEAGESGTLDRADAGQAGPDEASRVLDRLGPDVLGEVLERYLANPLFRAARYEELVLDDDPYRRPVRPDDLGMVDFAGTLTRDDATQLSGLMAHRMLLNILDTRKVLLPRTATPEKWESYARFYDPTTVSLGELLRPYLQRHVFTFARDEARPRIGATAAEVGARLREFAGHRAAQAAALAAVVATGTDRASLTQMLAIQSVGVGLSTRFRPPPQLPGLADSAAARALLPGADGTVPALPAAPDAAGIRDEPHSYLQYYLPSSLGLMNYLSATCEPGQVFAFAGALAARHLEAEALTGGGVWGEAGTDLVPAGGTSPSLADAVRDIERVAGGFGVREFSRGFEEYAVLLDVHHADRMRQFGWVTDMPKYREEAERLQGAIEEHRLDVDLDTFVESWEECSTTHVHDEDRLLVIESGEMEFWNCFGIQHKYQPGDKAFIPRHSLHGSVVLSGECVYHQPVITDELAGRYGSGRLT